MDRRDYTIDWYRKQDFQRPHSGSFEMNRRATGRGYAPSDFGDYRHDRGEYFEKRSVPHANGKITPGRGYPGQRYVPSDTGDYRETSPPMEPSPDYITGVPVLPQNPYKRAVPDDRSQQDVRPSGETFYNHAYEPPPPCRTYEQPYSPRLGPGIVSTNLSRTDANQGDAFIIYDGKKSNYIGQTIPTWVDKMTMDIDEKKKTKKSKIRICTMATVSRIFVMMLIVWDISNDWLLASSGPISFLNPDKSAGNCVINKKLFDLTSVNISSVDDYVCAKSESVWNAFGVLSLLGSLVSIIQLINIGCEMLMQCRPSVFQVLHGQSEVLLAIFFEELPQILLMTSMLYICDCSGMLNNESLPRLTVTMLMASISAAVSTTARFSISFRGIADDDGCCNTWWRSSCCENKDYCCRLNPKNLFCICNIPCPLCCCTLHCQSCKWTPRTWCSPLLKAFSCFCNCCREDKEMFGVRLINILGILLLWSACWLSTFSFT
ncbi:hypothetical protein FSP39_015764 [Pinctada imbricata]|uniref:Uncharacterized protein n=1 Tax=Pinctada imbricata TaxID=66713 RepID=A0AA88XPL4_PINIB|nr:hypothetical protein FSP39_015764 [Pinctada imbricata]